MVQGAALEKLKAFVIDFFKIDDDAKFHVEYHFSNALYGKFRSSSPLDVVKTALLDRWNDWGEVFIADLPNEYLLIQCNFQANMHNIPLAHLFPTSLCSIIYYSDLDPTAPSPSQAMGRRNSRGSGY